MVSFTEQEQNDSQVVFFMDNRLSFRPRGATKDIV